MCPYSELFVCAEGSDAAGSSCSPAGVKRCNKTLQRKFPLNSCRSNPILSLLNWRDTLPWMLRASVLKIRKKPKRQKNERIKGRKSPHFPLICVCLRPAGLCVCLCVCLCMSCVEVCEVGWHLPPVVGTSEFVSVFFTFCTRSESRRGMLSHTHTRSHTLHTHCLPPPPHPAAHRHPETSGIQQQREKQREGVNCEIGRTKGEPVPQLVEFVLKPKPEREGEREQTGNVLWGFQDFYFYSPPSSFCLLLSLFLCDADTCEKPPFALLLHIKDLNLWFTGFCLTFMQRSDSVLTACRRWQTHETLNKNRRCEILKEYEVYGNVDVTCHKYRIWFCDIPDSMTTFFTNIFLSTTSTILLLLWNNLIVVNKLKAHGYS